MALIVTVITLFVPGAVVIVTFVAEFRTMVADACEVQGVARDREHIGGALIYGNVEVSCHQQAPSIAWVFRISHIMLPSLTRCGTTQTAVFVGITTGLKPAGIVETVTP